MKTIKLNPKETGWIHIDSDVKTIIVHYNDDNKETMSPVEFLIMNKRKRNKVVQIDCYKEGEEIK